MELETQGHRHYGVGQQYVSIPTSPLIGHFVLKKMCVIGFIAHALWPPVNNGKIIHTVLAVKILYIISKEYIGLYFG